MKPYDHTHGYASILGNTRVSDLTLANFEGPSACGSAPDGPVYALSNHLNAPDASHPLFLKQVRPVAPDQLGLLGQKGRLYLGTVAAQTDPVLWGYAGRQ